MLESHLRKTIDDTRCAIGGLGKRYSEAEAIRLIKALGDCDTFVGPAFAYRHTPEQERARQAFHHACIALAHAIRQAVARPGRPDSEATVVGRVQAITAAADRLCEVFGWRGADLKLSAR
jgi:hypothetical protein